MCQLTQSASLGLLGTGDCESPDFQQRSILTLKSKVLLQRLRVKQKLYFFVYYSEQKKLRSPNHINYTNELIVALQYRKTHNLLAPGIPLNVCGTLHTWCMPPLQRTVFSPHGTIVIIVIIIKIIKIINSISNVPAQPSPANAACSGMKAQGRERWLCEAKLTCRVPQRRGPRWGHVLCLDRKVHFE